MPSSSVLHTYIYKHTYPDTQTQTHAIPERKTFHMSNAPYIHDIKNLEPYPHTKISLTKYELQGTTLNRRDKLYLSVYSCICVMILIKEQGVRT